MQISQEVLKSVLSASTDTITIAVLICLGTAFAFILGKRRAVTFILSFYPSILVYRSLPFLRQFVISNPINQNQAIIPVVLFLVIFLFINWSIYPFVSADFLFSSTRKLIESLIIGVFIAGFVILFSYQVVNLTSFHHFSSSVNILFSSTNFVWWLMAPFPVLYFLN